MGIAGQKPTDFFRPRRCAAIFKSILSFLSGRKGKARGTARKNEKGGAEERAASFP
jgi:hypothetical protein